jgi:hypothetical protein
VAAVPRLRPGFDIGPMQVIFLPAEVIDWERLGAIETVVMDRYGAGPDGRQRADMTLPLVRLSSADMTVQLPKSSDMTVQLPKAGPDA